MGEFWWEEVFGWVGGLHEGVEVFGVAIDQSGWADGSMYGDVLVEAM